jgi:hypothetical protein
MLLISAPLTSHAQAAYQALRSYLDQLMRVPSDCALLAVPSPLRKDLESFLIGKTIYHDAAGAPVVYGHDLAAWAHQIVYLTGLTYPLNLSAIDVDEIAVAIAYKV